MIPHLVYFSGVSENTHRFACKLTGVDVYRLPLKTSEAALVQIDRPYALLVPTYGGGNAKETKKSVPIQVIKFLGNEVNRSNLHLVIGSGNMNFGEEYGRAADIISAKCQVPVGYKFEVLGTPEDVTTVEEGLKTFWTTNFHITT